MTRRRRRATSSPQRVGSDAGLTTTRPTPPRATDQQPTEPVSRDRGRKSAGSNDEPAATAEDSTGAATTTEAGGRHTGDRSGAERRRVEQTTDDTDEGWGERGDEDATGRWLRENRPPHWS